MRVLRSSGRVAAPPERVFALLEDARMADQLNPEFLRTTVRSSPWIPKPGERTRAEVRHRGVRFELETEILEHRRGHFLLERQVAGPFASFEHAASVEEEDGAARLTEVLAYRLRLGRLGRLFDALVLRRDLEEALATRLRRLREILEREA